MPATIAIYYSDELENWSHSIDFCNEEIAELTERLAEVIRRNSIPEFAGKVEGQQTALNKVTQLFHKLQLQIQEQETALKSNSTLAEDKLINDATVLNQDVLRRNLQAVEKEFIDVKYNCHYFLSHLYKA
ncbi:MAG: hypothetical protein ACXWV0_00065 [Flavisolibacter sp.]